MILSRRRFLLVSAAAGSVAALTAACSPATPAAQTSGPAAAPTPGPTLAPTVARVPTQNATLKIGVLVPYTESSVGVDVGLNQKRAADLYLKQHGGKLGGRAVNLVYSAESVEANINKTKVKTLTDTEHVELLMGGASNDTAQVMRDAADALNMVYIDTNATANALSKSKYVFRTSASSWQLSEPLGEWAAKNGHIEFFVTSVDDTFGSESADAFVAGLMKSGGRATDRARIPSGGDWKKAITAILAQPTRDVFAAFYTDDAEGFLTQWNNQSASNAGYKLYGPGFLTDEEVLGQVKSAGDDVVTSLFWSPDLDTLENRTLVGTFPKEYTDEDTGEPVQLNGYAVQMWDAMTALDQALQQIGGATSNADVLIAALEAVSFKSPRGQFAFDKTTHNPIQDMYVRQVATSAAGKAVNAVIGKTASANVSS